MATFKVILLIYFTFLKNISCHENNEVSSTTYRSQIRYLEEGKEIEDVPKLPEIPEIPEIQPKSAKLLEPVVLPRRVINYPLFR